MKKHIAVINILLSALMVLTLCSCSGSKDEASVRAEESSKPSFSYTKQESSHSSASQSSRTEQSSQSSRSLPTGVSEYSKNKLRFTTSVLSLSAVFSDEFCIEADDYKPQYGIYLQNDTGTATLLIEAVNDTTMSYRQLKENLAQLYPDSEIRTTDKKEVICQRKMKDKSGKSYIAMQKFRVVKGGYHLAAICCHPEDKSVYYSVLSDIDFG